MTLISASVVPVAGSRPTGRLVHTGVATTNGIVGAEHGWPVPDFPMEPLAGARIGHGQSNIVFGMVGRASGVNYTAARLGIRYRYLGQVYSVIAWSAAVACVTKAFRQPRSCLDIFDQVQATVTQMAESP